MKSWTLPGIVFSAGCCAAARSVLAPKTTRAVDDNRRMRRRVLMAGASAISPDQFHCELSDAARSGAGDAPERRRRQRRVWVVEIHLIEDVEELAAQLQPQVRTEIHVSQHGEIGVHVAGPVNQS